MWRDVDHGSSCACLLLARAVGAPASCIDYAYCREVLQRRWHMTCNHGGRAPAPHPTPHLPPLDIHDPVHAVLIANAPAG